MRDVEVSFKWNSFKLKKAAALTMCAVMAMGVMTMPVHATQGNQIADTSAYTSDASYTGDASDEIRIPESLIDSIHKRVTSANGNSVGIQVFVGSHMSMYVKRTQAEWTSIETMVNKVLEEMKKLKYSDFDGRDVEDHQAYIKLMNDILALDKLYPAKITYDGKNTVSFISDGSSRSRVYPTPAEKPTFIATGDAKDPSKVIDVIKNTESNVVTIAVNEEATSLPKSVFQAAKDAGKKLAFNSKTEDGNNVSFEFKEGIKNVVDMDFKLNITTESDLVKDLKAEGAIVMEFAHEGVLPGPMNVRYYNNAYEDKEDATIFLYLLNEKTGKLEKQEQPVNVNRGWVSFTIDHCSSYVTTLTEIAAEKLQVTEAKPDKPSDNGNTGDNGNAGDNGNTSDKGNTSGSSDDAMKDTSSETSAFQTMGLLALCGVVVLIATKKEKKA